MKEKRIQEQAKSTVLQNEFDSIRWHNAQARTAGTPETMEQDHHVAIDTHLNNIEVLLSDAFSQAVLEIHLCPLCACL